MKIKTLSLAAGFAALLFAGSSIVCTDPVISSSSKSSVRISSARVARALGGGSYVKKLEFREPVKPQIEFLFIRNSDLLGNGRLPLVVQDFKYSETPL